ncbi:MAG: hypothetical protein Fues2KO_52810 [Fuerstiella sp.]
MPETDAEGRLLIYTERVLDGDTIAARDTLDNEFKIRLQGIDAPESDQPYGLDATSLLRGLLIGKTAAVELHDKDRYERHLGTIYVGEQNVNERMLSMGLAWHYTKYDRTPAYAAAEALAKRKSVGLWRSGDRIPPWDWRNGSRAVTTEVVPSIRTTDTTVYITKTGEKYHRGSCRYLRKSRIPIPLSRAKSAYEPCSRCNPPF